MSDTRLAEIHAWLVARYGDGVGELAPASVDASFRRYLRVTIDGVSRIVMDAPPDKEPLAPFVRVAQLFGDAGAHVPAILARDDARGFLLLEDLGTTTYLQHFQKTTADAHALMLEAIDTLVRIQRASRADTLPPYDAALLKRELDLFPDWFVARHLGLTLTAAQRALLDETNRLLIDAALAQPCVYVHRDYMPRNLMLSKPNPGVLDFQDAVYGPISYDIVSLVRDAFFSWPEEQLLDWVIRYWERARKAALPVPASFDAFWRDVEWMGVQRHLKVLGIFCRINYRDGKPHYLSDLPRFVAYVRLVAERYTALAPLARLFDELKLGEQLAVGYTF